jgi:hypothetical protein
MRYFCLLLILLMFGCKSEITPKVSHETYDFSIGLPEGWIHEKLQGIDSRIGIFTNKKDTLYYDFGWYTNGFDFEFGKDPEYTIQKIRIDKRQGQFLYPKNNQKGAVGVFLQVDKSNTLTIIGNSKNSREYYWDIFNTIVFKNNKWRHKLYAST